MKAFNVFRCNALSTCLLNIFLFCCCPLVCTATDSGIVLEDVSMAAGLGSEIYDSPTNHSLGVVWLDVNNDGYADIFAINGFNVSGNSLKPHLYVNNQDGTFSVADDLLPTFANLEYAGAVAADYDRDGDVDIYIYTCHETFSIHAEDDNPLDGPENLLLKNNFVEDGNVMLPGMFVDVATQAGLEDCTAEQSAILPPGSMYACYQARSAAFLDYDRDGHIDLYVGHMVMNRVHDMPGDVANTDILYRNLGNGTFEMVSGVLPSSGVVQRCAFQVTAGHLDSDMWPDIYVGHVGNDPLTMTNEDFRDTLLINNGGTSFSVHPSDIGGDTPAAMGIDFGDINDDLAFDIYLTDQRIHYSNTQFNIGNTLYLSQPGGGFGANAALDFGMDFDLSWGTNFVDFDLDGVNDLFVGSGRTTIPSVVFPSSDGSTVLQLNTNNVRGSAIADYDRDGDPDLLVVNEGGRLQLFRNDQCSPTHRWFNVNLIATDSNLDAIGARITVATVDGPVLIRQIKGGTSFHSQDINNEAFFGLGDRELDCVQIEWPSGIVQTFFDVPTNQTMNVIEALLGDVNLDGAVNLLDVAPFVNVIQSGTYQAEADINGDGVVNLLDVSPLIDILSP